MVTVICLTIDRVRLTNENKSLKVSQGEVIEANVLYIFSTVKDAQKSLEDNNDEKIIRDYWKFNEEARLTLPKRGLQDYLINLKNDYSELLNLIANSGTQQQRNEVKTRLNQKLSKLETSFKSIIKNCGNDPMNYYLLDSDDNSTMENILAILHT
jgi:hypothetical protein